MSSTILRPAISRAWRRRARAPISTSLCAGAHGQSADLGRHRNRVAVARQVVVELEGVDELLDAHGIPRRQLALRQEAADVGVRRRVDVGAKGRQRVRPRRLEAIRLDVRVALAGVAVTIAGPRIAIVADAVPGERLARFLGTHRTGARRWRRHGRAPLPARHGRAGRPAGGGAVEAGGGGTPPCVRR